MILYDKAHDLARALQSSREYQTVLAAKQAIAHDDGAVKMVTEFIRLQMAAEYDKMTGATENGSRMEQLQKLSSLIAANSAAREFLQAQIRFQQTLGDIYKILGESIAEGMDIFAKK